MILFFMIFCTSSRLQRDKFKNYEKKLFDMEIKKLETFHQMTIEKFAKVEGGNWVV